MANQNHLNKLNEGVSAWNEWRKSNPDEIPDLAHANLSERDLSNVDFSNAQMLGVNMMKSNLTNADFSNATVSSHWQKGLLRDADLTNANLKGADFYEANLMGAKFTGAKGEGLNIGWSDCTNTDFTKGKFQNAMMRGANFNGTNFNNADISGSLLDQARFSHTQLNNTNLSNCTVWGVSTWNVAISEGTKQHNLKIASSPYLEREKIDGEILLVLNDIEVAQFMYMIMTNAKIRNVIDASTSKIILILGRFSADRFRILNAIRVELQKLQYVPVIFDFTPSESRDLTETVKLLASLAKGVIADLTDPKSIPQELSVIVPNLPSVPVKPILLKENYESGDEVREYAMYEHWRNYPWVLDLFKYEDEVHLKNNLQENILSPLENFIHRKNIAADLKIITRKIYSGAADKKISEAIDMIENLKGKFGTE